MSYQINLPNTGIGYIKSLFEQVDSEFAPAFFALDLYPYYWQLTPENDDDPDEQYFTKSKLTDFIRDDLKECATDKDFCLRILFPQITTIEQWRDKLNSLGSVVQFTLTKQPHYVAENNLDNNKIVLNCLCYEDEDNASLSYITLEKISSNDFYQVVNTSQTYQEIKASHKLRLASVDECLITDSILVSLQDILIGPFNYQKNNEGLDLLTLDNNDYYIYEHKYNPFKKHVLSVKDYQFTYIRAFNNELTISTAVDFIKADELSALMADALAQFTQEEQELINALYQRAISNNSVLTQQRFIEFRDYFDNLLNDKLALTQIIDSYLLDSNNQYKLLNHLVSLKFDDLKKNLTSANFIKFTEALYSSLLNNIASDIHNQAPAVAHNAIELSKQVTLGNNTQESFNSFLSDEATLAHINNLIKQGDFLIERIEHGYSQFQQLKHNASQESLSKYAPRDQLRFMAGELSANVNMAALYLGFINDILGLLRSIYRADNTNKTLNLFIVKLSNISIRLNNCYGQISTDEYFKSKASSFSAAQYTHSALNTISALTYLPPQLFLNNHQGLISKSSPNALPGLDEATNKQQSNNALLEMRLQKEKLQSSIEKAKIELFKLQEQILNAHKAYQDKQAQLSTAGNNHVLFNNLLEASDKTKVNHETEEKTLPPNHNLYVAKDMFKRNHLYDDGNKIISRVHSFIINSDYRNFSFNDTVNLLMCLTHGFITTLSGKPGCGKTSLSRLVAQALGLVDPKDSNDLQSSHLSRFTEVSVEKDWRSVKDFVGYYNPISKKLEKSNSNAFDSFMQLHHESLYQIQHQGSLDPTYPYLMLLDEANLSSLEYYWSPFFSACDLASNHRPYLNLGGDHKFILPKQLRFITTINDDHTTEPLSARFIDRSFIITLGITKTNEPSLSNKTPNLYNQGIITYEQLLQAFNSAKNLPRLTVNPFNPNDLANSKWQEIYDLFSHEQQLMPLSERSCQMLLRYCANACLYMDKQGADHSLCVLDYALAQKILPTIKGSGSAYQKLLEELLRLCPHKSMPLSHSHLERMYKQGNESMFYQFFSF